MVNITSGFADFPYIENTKINIDGKEYLIRMENGMTGIGSRAYWINDRKQFGRCVTKSVNIEEGIHSIYTIKWRDNPWDLIDIIIHEDFVEDLLSKENEWREPKQKIL